MGPARRALVTSIGLVLLRPRLQRRSGPGAAAALVALELFGPRLFRLRRLAMWILALTIIGGLGGAAVLGGVGPAGSSRGAALAERHGVRFEEVTVCSGADAVIGFVCQATLDPGDEVVTGWPSFVSYVLDPLKLAAVPVKGPLRDDRYDLDG